MRKISKETLKLVYGANIPTITSSNVGEWYIVGEYNGSEIRDNLLFLTTAPNDIKLYEQYPSRYSVIVHKGATTCVLNSELNRFLGREGDAVAVTHETEQDFEDFLREYVSHGTTYPKKYRISLRRRNNGTITCLYPTDYFRPKMLSQSEHNKNFSDPEDPKILIPTDRAKWNWITIETLPDDLEYPKQFSGLSCPKADAFKLIKQLHSDGVYPVSVGKNATRFFILSLKKYTGSKHPKVAYGKYISDASESFLGFDWRMQRGKVIPHKIKCEDVAHVGSDACLLFNKHGELYPSADNAPFDVLTTHDIIFQDGSILTCDREQSEYAVFANSTLRYIPHELRVQHLGNKDYIAIKKTDIDKCTGSCDEYARKYTDKYMLSSLDYNILIRYLNAGYLNELERDLELSQAEKNRELLHITDDDSKSLGFCYKSFLKSGNILSSFDYDIRLRGDELLLKVFRDKEFAKFTAAGELLIPTAQLFEIANYLPYLDEILDSFPKLGKVFSGAIENSQAIRKHLLSTI